jgi:Cu+-exporting ATPase
MIKDPVCGMQVDEKSAAGSVEHEDQTYYFCSVSCQRAFETDPGAYARRA